MSENTTTVVTLSAVKEVVGAYLPTVDDTWVSDQQTRGDLVALYRNYVDGVHDAKLTDDMKNMLRLDREGEEFNINYCGLIIQAMANRANLDTLEVADDDAATEWLQEQLRLNRLDALQMTVHDAVLTDGDTFVSIKYEPGDTFPVLFHEPAYDGAEGCLAVYDSQFRNLEAIIKIYARRDASGDVISYVNVYTPDLIYQYSGAGGEIALDNKFANATGIIPFQHFPNRPRRKKGISELASAITLQDALNRTIVSMVMTSELSAFQIRIAKGFEPPKSVTPGMWVQMKVPTGFPPEHTAEVLAELEASVLPPAELVPFIDEAQFLAEQLSIVTSTPIPSLMGGDTQSGEALKQREIGLLGKIERFQVTIGNAWEDLAEKMFAIASTFSAAVPEAALINARWKEAEVRNDTERVQMIIELQKAGIIGQKEALRQLAPILGYEQAQIDNVIQESIEEETGRFTNFFGTNQPPLTIETPAQEETVPNG